MKLNCFVENCGRIAEHRLKTAQPMCPKHYQRLRRVGSYEDSAVKQYRGKKFIDNKGYIVMWYEGRPMKEHRVIMEQALGRKLLKGENVHHKNGVRTDNRPENLELWITSQPSGQRVEDLVSWAEEILRRYKVAS